MTWFDFLVIAILVVSTGLAYIRGLSRELSTLLCLIAAAGMTYIAAGPLSDITGISQITLLSFAITICLFALFFVLWAIFLDAILCRCIGNSPKKPDRILGGLFGFIRGYVLTGFIFLALAYYSTADTQPSVLDKGIITPLARTAATALETFNISASPPAAAPPHSPTPSEREENSQDPTAATTSTTPPKPAVKERPVNEPPPLAEDVSSAPQNTPEPSPPKEPQ